MANSSLDENYTSEINQTSTESGSAGPLVIISALNIVLSITATLGNALILVALHKETAIHSPTKLLFRCLAVTDLCAGLISQPLFVVAVVARIIDINFQDEVSIFTGVILCEMSTLISAAISVDRLLALLLGLRYRHVVTLRRTRAVIVCFFTISVSCGAMYFWSQTISWIADNVFGVLSLIISILCYTKIYLTLRHNQAQVQNHVHQGQQNGGEIPLNIARYKKIVSSIAWVQLALVACYAPFNILSLLLLNYSNSESIFVVYSATVTLVYLNSSLNPILYCWKIKEVRQTVKDTIRQFCCLCN